MTFKLSQYYNYELLSCRLVSLQRPLILLLRMHKKV